eukprot:XP_012809803.1 PREDICTED: uncharacterized protein LOC105945692 [Xenopus tropicalis]
MVQTTVVFPLYLKKINVNFKVLNYVHDARNHCGWEKGGHKRLHLPTMVSPSSSSDAEEKMPVYLGSPEDLSDAEGTDRDYRPEEATGKSNELPPPSSGPSSSKRMRQESRLRNLKLIEFENEALVEGLVPLKKILNDAVLHRWITEELMDYLYMEHPMLRVARITSEVAERNKGLEAMSDRSGTGGGPGKRVHFTRFEELLLSFLHRESVRGVSGTFDTDRNVGQDSSLSPPGPSRRRQTASAPIPGGCSSSGLHSPQHHSEMQGETFSGEESERRSHVGGGDVAFFSDEEPANIPQQQQLQPQATGERVAHKQPLKARFHKTLIRNHKAVMHKLHLVHTDLCVATNAYNEGQARQAAHESAMLSLHEADVARKAHEAAILSLQEEKVELKRQQVALLAEQNALLKQQIAALQQQGQKLTEPISSTSGAAGESTAPTPAGSTRQLRKRK